jgi:hypothetical protein
MTVHYISLFGLDVKLEAAIISAGVAFLTALITPLVRHQFDRRLQAYQLRTEHEYAQRRALQRLIGSFHGRLVEAADLFHLRMLNLYLHRGEDWLDVSADDYGNLERYYFHSSVLRFLTLLSLATRFETSAFFIESEFGSKRDVRFLFFAKAIRWTATDTDLFARVDPPYNVSEATDHFYTDHLGEMCTLIVEKKDTERACSSSPTW